MHAGRNYGGRSLGRCIVVDADQQGTLLCVRSSHHADEDANCKGDANPIRVS
jgi:hypothetical protein